MSNIPIYERCNTPFVELGQRWIRLVVNDPASADDQKSEDEFITFAEHLGRVLDAREQNVLTILRATPEERKLFGELPQLIIGGTVSYGPIGIRSRLMRLINQLQEPLVI